MSYFNYGTTFRNLENNLTFREVRSICYPPKMPLKTSMVKTTIKSVEEYRPDKISYRLFGDPLLSWVLDEINNFYLISDYYSGREIYYLNEYGLSAIGVEVDYISFESQNF
jgi:hypothetical protein